MFHVLELNFELANIEIDKDWYKISTKNGAYDIAKSEFDGIVITVDANKLEVYRTDDCVKLKILTNSSHHIATQFDEDYKEILIDNEHRICLSLLSESTVKIDFHSKLNNANDYIWLATVSCQI